LKITPQTSFFKHGELAITTSPEVGDAIRGLLREDVRGHFDAVRLYDRERGREATLSPRRSLPHLDKG
jgi:hypothetical protein